MIVGFTGTRKGMTDEQKRKFYELLYLWNPDEFHHGDCIGADADAHYYARKVAHDRDKKILIVGHIPEKDRTRAFCKVDVRRDPLPYLDRDLAIVQESDRMVACPEGFIELQRSGTWATVRMARRELKPLYIIRPDGSVLEENVV